MKPEELLKLLVDLRHHLERHAADYHHRTPVLTMAALNQAIAHLNTQAKLAASRKAAT